MRMYEGEGAMVERQVDDLAAKAKAALADGDLTLRVAALGLLHGSDIVSDTERRAEYLFTLFCEGVRELTFLQGLTRDELLVLVDVLGTSVKDDESQDLVSLLWEKELPHVRWYVVDIFVAGLELDESGQLTLASRKKKVNWNAEGGEELSMSPDDIRLLRDAEGVPWLEPAHAPAAATGEDARQMEMVRSSWESPRDAQRFVSIAQSVARSVGSRGEPSPLIVSQLDASIASGNGEEVAGLLGAIAGLGRSGEELREIATSEERLVQLEPVIDPENTALFDALQRLLPDAEKGLVTLLTQLKPGGGEERLSQLLIQAGADLTPYYAMRLQEDEPEVVEGAIRALKSLDRPDAYRALSTVLGHSLTRLRKSALEALQGHYIDEARTELARALRDPDRDNRMLALKVLAVPEARRVTPALINAIKAANFARRDEEEQAEFFRTLGVFADRRCVEFLAGFLADRNLARSRGVTNRQILAVRALGQMKTDEARAALSGANGWYLAREVKDAIQRALTGGA